MRLTDLICGVHPDNTIFNYNWCAIGDVRRAVREQIGAVRGPVLDIGAGRSPYRELFDASLQYVSVDPAPAARRVRRPGTQPVSADGRRLPFADASFEFVMATQVLTYLDDPAGLIAEAARVLKPGGRLLATVPHISPVLEENVDLLRFTPSALVRFSEEAGLRPEVRELGGLFKSCALLVGMSLVLTPRHNGTPMTLRPVRQVMLAPLVGAVNATCWLLDKLIPTTRVPTNLALTAVK